jgi:hypothetical protein
VGKLANISGKEASSGFCAGLSVDEFLALL